MKSHDAFLLKTAAEQRQWPQTDLPELVFCGRSNAGKSSLINALTNRKNLAYSGKTPGKTRLLNFFLVDKRVIFADAPGYGYAQGIKNAAEKFRMLMDPYMGRRQQLKGMVIVLDCRRVPNADDQTMVEYAKARHLPIIGVCTKVDKLSRSQLLNQMKVIAQTLDLPRESLLPCNNLKKIGVDEIWQAIDEIIQEEA